MHFYPSLGIHSRFPPESKVKMFLLKHSIFGFINHCEIVANWNRHGAQGEMNGASHQTLDNEFGTHNEEEVIKKILEKGTIQESQVRTPSPYHPPSLPTLLVFNDQTLIKHHSSLNDRRPKMTPWAAVPVTEH
jgi:hypothetical protein